MWHHDMWQCDMWQHDNAVMKCNINWYIRTYVHDCMHDRWPTLTRDSMTVLAWHAKTLIHNSGTTQKGYILILECTNRSYWFIPFTFVHCCLCRRKERQHATTNRNVTCQWFIPFVVWCSQPHFQSPFYDVTSKEAHCAIYTTILIIIRHFITVLHGAVIP